MSSGAAASVVPVAPVHIHTVVPTVEAMTPLTMARRQRVTTVAGRPNRHVVAGPVTTVGLVPTGSPVSEQFEVFLSHASADRDHVELVRGQIEALGVRVYLAEHDPRPGTSLAGKVDVALRRATLVVVLITSTSIDSQYVQQEIGAALAYQKPIIPVVDSRIAGRIDLGMLTGAEYLVLDTAQPAEAMRQITATLQSLVRARTPAAHPVPVQLTPTFSDTEKLLLVGAVALFVVLLLSESGGGAGA